MTWQITPVPAYTLEGRAWEGDKTEAACIFCGQKTKHFNEGGRGWCLGAVYKGEIHHYLYCAHPVCAHVVSHGEEIWRCGCDGGGYVENVGANCHACGCLRADAVAVDDDEEVN